MNDWSGKITKLSLYNNYLMSTELTPSDNMRRRLGIKIKTELTIKPIRNRDFYL